MYNIDLHRSDESFRFNLLTKIHAGLQDFTLHRNDTKVILGLLCDKMYQLSNETFYNGLTFLTFQCFL